jgi:hypothetical protein
VATLTACSEQFFLASLYYYAAGILACICGSGLRVILEFALPKDGSLVVLGQYALNYGAAIAGLPTFMETVPDSNAASSLTWNPDKDTCQQSKSSFPFRTISSICITNIFIKAGLPRSKGSMSSSCHVMF